jgi:hypothetical protein
MLRLKHVLEHRDWAYTLSFQVNIPSGHYASVQVLGDYYISQLKTSIKKINSSSSFGADFKFEFDNITKRATFDFGNCPGVMICSN